MGGSKLVCLRRIGRYNARVLTSLTDNKSLAAQSLKDRLCGLLLPITTPFQADGTLDLDGLRSNIQKWNDTNIRGYVVLGSTGERVHLDEREYLQVVETARAAVPDELAFIVGAGQQSTLGTINEIGRVAEIRVVDAVLVITPHFYRAGITQAVLVEHYRAIADASRIPVILYTMPALTGIKIEPDTAGRLSEHENIIGIKDSSAETELLRQTVGLVRQGFAVLTGNGTVLDAGLIAGACGAILAVGCVAPELCLAIIEAVRSGDSSRAANLQAKLSPLAAAVTTHYGLGGLKSALEMIGYAGGTVRAPLRMPDEVGLSDIRRCLVEADMALGGSGKAPLIAVG
jgi:4-hydroxy-2-oxoglutarate aldolase